MGIFTPYTMLKIRYLPANKREGQNLQPILWTFGFNGIFARVLSGPSSPQTPTLSLKQGF